MLHIWHSYNATSACYQNFSGSGPQHSCRPNWSGKCRTPLGSKPAPRPQCLSRRQATRGCDRCCPPLPNPPACQARASRDPPFPDGYQSHCKPYEAQNNQRAGHPMSWLEARLGPSWRSSHGKHDDPCPSKPSPAPHGGALSNPARPSAGHSGSHQAATSAWQTQCRP